MSTLKKTVVYIALTALLVNIAYQYRTSRFQQDISGELLRFHVLANSDSREDQAVKLKVRDEIGMFMQEKLQGAENLQECIQIVQENIPQITRIGEEVIDREGYHYSVSAGIAETDFPKKQYGSFTFPAGNYLSLVITLGEGRGHNWWCVMYPNMCFSGSVYEVVDEDTKEKLKEVLTKEEYQELMAESQMEVKFKYWEKLKELPEAIEKFSFNH